MCRLLSLNWITVFYSNQVVLGLFEPFKCKHCRWVWKQRMNMDKYGGGTVMLWACFTFIRTGNLSRIQRCGYWKVGQCQISFWTGWWRKPYDGIKAKVTEKTEKLPPTQSSERTQDCRDCTKVTLQFLKNYYCWIFT